RSLNGDLSKMSGYHPYDPDIYPPAGAGCESAAPWNVPNAMLRRLNTIASHMRIAECGGTGTALILHDSFLDSIERYVTDDFKRSWLVWNYPGDKDFGWLIDKLHPDTVLVERVERLMHYPGRSTSMRWCGNSESSGNQRASIAMANCSSAAETTAKRCRMNPLPADWIGWSVTAI